eukprot:75213_1
MNENEVQSLSTNSSYSNISFNNTKVKVYISGGGPDHPDPYIKSWTRRRTPYNLGLAMMLCIIILFIIVILPLYSVVPKEYKSTNGSFVRHNDIEKENNFMILTINQSNEMELVSTLPSGTVITYHCHSCKYNYSSIPNHISLYKMLLCLNNGNCHLNTNYVWTMFIGDSNTRNSMVAMFDSLKTQIKPHSTFKVIDSMNNIIWQKSTEFMNKNMYPDELKGFVHPKWSDKEWFVIIYEKNGAIKYFIRISFRFLVNINPSNSQYNLTEFKFINDDFNKNIGFYNISFNLNNPIVLKLSKLKSKPDILYLCHGLWGIEQLVENEQLKNRNYSNQTWYNYLNIANYLKYWNVDKHIDIFWITNFHINYHNSINNQLIDYDFIQTKLYAEMINIGIFSIYDIVKNNTNELVLPHSYHYNHIVSDMFQKFVVQTLLHKMCRDV